MFFVVLLLERSKCTWRERRGKENSEHAVVHLVLIRTPPCFLCLSLLAEHSVPIPLLQSIHHHPAKKLNCKVHSQPSRLVSLVHGAFLSSFASFSFPRIHLTANLSFFSLGIAHLAPFTPTRTHALSLFLLTVSTLPVTLS